MSLFQVYIRGAHVGTLEITQESQSYSYVCPKCGDAWCKLVSDLQNESSPYYHIHHRRCPEHEGGYILHYYHLMGGTFKLSSNLLRTEFLHLFPRWERLGPACTSFYRP